LDFELKPAGALAGRVTDTEGQPVPTATVYVIDAQHLLLDRLGPANSVTTGLDGRYAFPGLPDGVIDLGVRVLAGGYLPALRKDVTVPEVGRSTVDFVLEHGRAVKAHLEGEWSGATVWAADSRLKGRLLPPGGVKVLVFVGREFVEMPVVVVRRVAVATTILPGIGPGAADVWAEADYRLTETGLGRILNSTAPEVTLRLLRYAHVKIRAFDSATGDELEPKVTRLTGDLREPAPYEPISDLVRVPVDTRRHKLLFELEGYESVELALPDMSKEEPEPSEKPFALQLDVAMTPHSSDEAKGSFYLLFEPAHKSGRIAVVGRDAAGRRRFVLHPEEQDDQGRWLVEKVPVGTYDLTILASGKIPVTLPGIGVTSAAKPTHRVTLTDGGGIDLRITGPDGKLLEKVHILLRDATERQIDVQIISMVSGGRAFIAVNYLPTVAAAKSDSGLAPGSYTLMAAKEGYGPASADFTIQSTEVAEVALTLRPK
ncbi:MAG: carboxypeptidase-like regulatory domain-containing protein, partial [Planctomycetota bacterium]|nr:carboxypeptidase-like regulatory domain-containing protein [Planctomycetota bacterium]